MATESTINDTEPEAARREDVTTSHLYGAIECDRPLAGGLRISLDRAREVLVRRGAARSVEVEDRGARIVLTLADRRVSSTHARLFRTAVGWSIEDSGSTNGTLVDSAPCTAMPLTSASSIEIGGTFLLLRPNEPTPIGTAAVLDADTMKSRHPSRQTLMPRLAAELASVVVIGASELSVLLVGESGSGKEGLVRALHDASGRSGAFVGVNCGAIPESLLESYLFGHVKGSFSGATRDQLGLVRAADGGMLFLDEIGDLRPSSQAALLRVLQEGEVLPVGASRPIKVNVRVLSATHHRIDLERARATFRADFYAPRRLRASPAAAA